MTGVFFRMSSFIMLILFCIIIMLGIVFYVTRMLKYQEDEWGQRVLGFASQLTMSAFMLGFAFNMILVNIISIGKSKYVYYLVAYAAFVMVINTVSILYYEKKIKK